MDFYIKLFVQFILDIVKATVIALIERHLPNVKIKNKKRSK